MASLTFLTLVYADPLLELEGNIVKLGTVFEDFVMVLPVRVENLTISAPSNVIFFYTGTLFDDGLIAWIHQELFLSAASHSLHVYLAFTEGCMLSNGW